VFSPYTGNVCKTGEYTTASSAPNGYFQMNFSMTPAGSNNYDGSSGYGSKPPTVAIMWILRFI